MIQIRATQINSLGLINTFINELNQHQNKLNDGALMTFDEKGTRIRWLPL
jgi:predicted nuclease of predicted toxin-antitoxin system